MFFSGGVQQSWLLLKPVAVHSLRFAARSCRSTINPEFTAFVSNRKARQAARAYTTRFGQPPKSNSTRPRKLSDLLAPDQEQKPLATPEHYKNIPREEAHQGPDAHHAEESSHDLLVLSPVATLEAIGQSSDKTYAVELTTDHSGETPRILTFEAPVKTRQQIKR